MKSKIIFILFMLNISMIFLCLYGYKNISQREVVDEKNRMKQYILYDFIRSAERQIRKQNHEEEYDDFYDAIAIKSYIEAIENEDEKYIITNDVCQIFIENNITNIIQNKYIKFIRDRDENDTITLNTSFQNGLVKIKQKCKSIQSKKF